MSARRLVAMTQEQRDALHRANLVWCGPACERCVEAMAALRAVVAAFDEAPSDPVSVIQSMLPMPDAFANTRRNWAADIAKALGWEAPHE